MSRTHGHVQSLLAPPHPPPRHLPVVTLRPQVLCPGVTPGLARPLQCPAPPQVPECGVAEGRRCRRLFLTPHTEAWGGLLTRSDLRSFSEEERARFQELLASPSYRASPLLAVGQQLAQQMQLHGGGQL